MPRSPRFTTQHHAAIATALHSALNASVRESTSDGVEMATEKIGQMLRLDNPRFDWERFSKMVETGTDPKPHHTNPRVVALS